MNFTLLAAVRPYLLRGSLTLLRVWLAAQWLNAGLHKVIDPKWMDGSGRGLLSFWSSALAPTAHGGSAITYDWYRAFLQLLVDAHAYTWFAPLIAIGETSVGLGLLVGALVPMAAAGGLTMNMAYLLAGAGSVNPILALSAGVLLFGRRHAGVIGLDGALRLVARTRLAAHSRRLGRLALRTSLA
jgi:thiosulfate dehydrogenase [quinone] large subunit